MIYLDIFLNLFNKVRLCVSLGKRSDKFLFGKTRNCSYSVRVLSASKVRITHRVL